MKKKINNKMYFTPIQATSRLFDNRGDITGLHKNSRNNETIQFTAGNFSKQARNVARPCHDSAD